MESKFREKAKQRLDLTDHRFGRLQAICYEGTTKHQKSLWLCRCDCGNEVRVTTGVLMKGESRSCGCLQAERTKQSNTTHGEACKTVEYTTWNNIKKRCYDTKDKNFHLYGARGIKVSEEWVQSYENFLRDMGRKPDKSYSIERIDNSKGYSKENCRWATSKEQSRNTRRNNNISFNGRTQCLTDWAKEVGISHSTLSCRLFRYGWSIEKALNTPNKSF